MNCSKVAATHKIKSKKTKNKNDADEVSRSSGSHFMCALSWANFKSWSRVQPLRRHCLHMLHGLAYASKLCLSKSTCSFRGLRGKPKLLASIFKNTPSRREEMNVYWHIHNMDHGYSLACLLVYLQTDLNTVHTPRLSFCNDWVSSIRCVLWVGGILKLRVCQISCPWRPWRLRSPSSWSLGRHGG